MHVLFSHKVDTGKDRESGQSEESILTNSS